jgi:hypothetical protein
LTVALGASLIAIPAAAETHAAKRLDHALDGRGTSARQVRVGFDGLTLEGLDTVAGGHRWLVGSVHVAIDTAGVRVTARDLAWRGAMPATPKVPSSTVADTETPSTSESPRALIPGLSRARTLGRRLRGIPVTARVLGEWSVPGAGGDLVVRSGGASVDRNGRVRADLSAAFDRGEGARAELSAEVETTLRRGAPVTIRSEIDGDEVLGHFGVDVEVLGPSAAARVIRGDGGALVRVRRDSDRDRVTIQSERFGLAWLGAALQSADLPASIDLDDARMSGGLVVERLDHGWSASFDDFRLSAAGIHHGALARDAIQIDTVAVSGSAGWGPGERSFVGRISHGAVAMDVSLNSTPERFDAGLSVEPVGCQQLLHSIPRGFMSVLEGMQLEGDVAGSFSISVDRTDLARYRADEATAGPLEVVPPPGSVEFGLPVLDACTIVQEPPGVDVESLVGAYRHQFVADDGTSRDRVLATGAPGFINIAGAGKVASSFVVMEDARFFAHDGFDRPQIEKALWHNIAHGRVDRGASTISQQTARNLWLGIDRSLGRKLQEAFLTAHLERHVEKRRILEVYLNIIELGPAVHGIVDASWFHFDRPISQLNGIEALHLAALAPAPALFSRRFAAGSVPADWRDNLNRQARRLRLHGYRDAPDRREARRLELGLVDRAAASAP